MSQRKKIKMSEKKEESTSVTPKYKFKSICIFGDTDEGKDVQFLTAAQDLGRELAARKINFVYGGGIQGLKGSMAISATIQGSKGLNVRVKELERHTFSLGTDLQVVSLPERIGGMFYYAEAFIALPGGLETLDGISTIMYWAKLNFHRKPLGLLNVNGFYDSLLFFLDHGVEMGFIPKATRQSIISAPTADQLLNQLELYEPKRDPVPQQTGGQSLGSDQQEGLDTTLRL